MVPLTPAGCHRQSATGRGSDLTHCEQRDVFSLQVVQSQQCSPSPIGAHTDVCRPFYKLVLLRKHICNSICKITDVQTRSTYSSKSRGSSSKSANRERNCAPRAPSITR